MQKIVSLVILVVALLLVTFKPALAADDCSSKFPISKGGDLLYCSNKDINTADPSIKRLVIVIHGTNRTASNYFGYMTSAAQGANSTDSLIIAPHFVIPGDVSDSTALTWAENEGWKVGDPSQSSQVSSYEAIDNLITSIIDGKKFPNMKSIVVVGHSAGGQYSDRYAAGTQIDGKVKEAGMKIRYIVANPSSYLYFTPERPVNGSETEFANPSGGCSDYDNYKYGFQGMNAYMNAVGPEKIKAQFKDKNVIYLLGDQDTDPNDSDLDKNCGAQAQGAFRFQRGSAYCGYLKHLYGDATPITQYKVPVPGVAHDNNAMFNSAEGKKYIFSDDNPDPSAACFGSANAASSSSSSAPATTSSSSSSSSGNTDLVPSAVCAGSTTNVCPSPEPSKAPTTSSSSSSSSPSDTATGSPFGDLNNLDSTNILVLFLTLLLKLFTGF